MVTVTQNELHMSIQEHREVGKKQALGCVNSPPAARGSLEAVFTQSRTHFAQLCILYTFSAPRSWGVKLNLNRMSLFFLWSQTALIVIHFFFWLNFLSDYVYDMINNVHGVVCSACIAIAIATATQGHTVQRPWTSNYIQPPLIPSEILATNQTSAERPLSSPTW